jgi:hypothetical protein
MDKKFLIQRSPAHLILINDPVDRLKMHKHLSPNLLSRLILSLFLAIILSLGLTANTAAQASKSDAAAIAKAQTGGRVLQVKQNKAGHYRVKVLMPNGQMRHIIIGKPNPSSKK